MTYWVAGAAIGGAVISGTMQSNAASDAADAQSDAARASDATQRYFYDTTRNDQMPFLQTGYKANDQLSNLLASGKLNTPTFAQYQADPSYQWQQNEAMRIGQNTAAARNGLYRGSTAKALQGNAQNIANAGYSDWWNRQQQGASNSVNLLNAIISGGQTAAGQIGSAAGNAASAISGNQQALGNALGANALAQGNVWGGAVNRLTSYGNQNNWWQKPTNYGSDQYGNAFTNLDVMQN